MSAPSKTARFAPTMAVLVLACLGTVTGIPSVLADYDAGRRALEAGDPGTAASLWKTAAQAGDRPAMLALGRLYLRGLGVVQDYVEAHKWLGLASSMGEIEAAKERDALAVKMTGDQIARAGERAFAELRSASARGVPWAMLAIGRLHVRGTGILQDYVQGYKWLFLATSAGVEAAANERDALAAKMAPDRVAKAQQEAVSELQTAAERGDRRSMLMLGRLQLDGLGVVQDYVEAHKWFNLAASKGETDALSARDSLAAKMTLVQIARAQELASGWRPRPPKAETSAPAPVARSSRDTKASRRKPVPGRNDRKQVAATMQSPMDATVPKRRKGSANDAPPLAAATESSGRPDCFSSKWIDSDSAYHFGNNCDSGLAIFYCETKARFDSVRPCGQGPRYYHKLIILEPGWRKNVWSQRSETGIKWIACKVSSSSAKKLNDELESSAKRLEARYRGKALWNKWDDTQDEFAKRIFKTIDSNGVATCHEQKKPTGEGCFQTSSNCISEHIGEDGNGDYQLVGLSSRCKGRIVANICAEIGDNSRLKEAYPNHFGSAGATDRNHCGIRRIMPDGKNYSIATTKVLRPTGRFKYRWVGSTIPDNDSVCMSMWRGDEGQKWGDPMRF